MNAWLIVSILLGVWAVLGAIAYERERRVREMEEMVEQESTASPHSS